MLPGPNPYKTDVFNAPPGEEATCLPLEVEKGTDAKGRTFYCSCWELEEGDVSSLKRKPDEYRLWVTLYCGCALAVRVCVGREPVRERLGEVAGMVEHTRDGQSVVYCTKWLITPAQVEKLAAGERLWLVLWSEAGLPPAAMEIAKAPWHRY